MILEQDDTIKEQVSDNLKHFDNFYKVILDNEVIGLGALAFSGRDMIYIQIKSEKRGNGYGTKLFSKLIEILKDSKINNVFVTYETKNLIMKRIVSHYENHENFRNLEYTVDEIQI